MIFVVQSLACMGVFCGFRMFGDSFCWGWAGGVTCSIVLHFMQPVPA